MKISELITQLENDLKRLGDLPVTVNIDGFGGHATYSTVNTYETAVHPWELCENDDPSASTIHEFFPDWIGNPEDFKNADLESPCLMIGTGVLLSAT
jgi:hypothetical protein